METPTVLGVKQDRQSCVIVIRMTPFAKAASSILATGTLPATRKSQSNRLRTVEAVDIYEFIKIEYASMRVISPQNDDGCKCIQQQATWFHYPAASSEEMCANVHIDCYCQSVVSGLWIVAIFDDTARQ